MCGRNIKRQQKHNDPEIWSCFECDVAVCDWCYHYHFATHESDAEEFEVEEKRV